MAECLPQENHYRIQKNSKYNSIEVYFDSKPADTVRLALKRLKMRWHFEKKCWYGYADENSIISAIIENAPEEQPATVLTDGYMGGGAVYGSKSKRHLYGADLSAAIRADIKAAGIKGVTVKCKTYSGGQSITATLRTKDEDYISEDDFVAAYQVRGQWVYDGTKPVHADTYYNMSADGQERLRTAAARYEYEKYKTTEQYVSIRHIEEYNFTQATIDRIKRVDDIISAYRYDESNAMVDYFNTNFYYHICVKPETVAQPTR